MILLLSPEVLARNQEPGFDYAAKQLNKAKTDVSALGIKRQEI